MFGHLASGATGYKSDNPQSTPWIFNQHRIAKGIRLRRDHSLKDLFCGPIDCPHDGHAIENRFTKPDDPATEETRRDGTNHRDQNQADDQPGTRNIGKNKLIEPGKDAGHLPVNQLNRRPGDIDRQQNRRSDKKSGQEPGPQACQNAGAFHRRLSGYIGHGKILISGVMASILPWRR